MKSLSQRIVHSKTFEYFIITVILVNCIMIGVETYGQTFITKSIQSFCLAIFTLEIIIRMSASNSIKDYLYNGWNIFDLSIVLVSFIPESMFENSAAISALRVMRVFRVLRLLKISKEIQLIIAVLIKSTRSLSYNALFYGIFLYLYAIIGVTLFKLPDEKVLEEKPELVSQMLRLNEIAPHAPSNSKDPYGTLDESVFTLFRVMTGDDWTDVRYNLVTANELGLVASSANLITFYHVSWFVISAFLLLNLVVGAVLNNYQIIMDEAKENEKMV